MNVFKSDAVIWWVAIFCTVEPPAESSSDLTFKISTILVGNGLCGGRRALDELSNEMNCRTQRIPRKIGGRNSHRARDEVRTAPLELNPSGLSELSSFPAVAPLTQVKPRRTGVDRQLAEEGWKKTE